MKQTSVFRVTGDICFYFAVLNVFSVFRAWRLPMALFTALCFALGFVIVRCRQGGGAFCSVRAACVQLSAFAASAAAAFSGNRLGVLHAGHGPGQLRHAAV